MTSKRKRNCAATKSEIRKEVARRLRIIDPTGTMLYEYDRYGCQISALCFRSCNETDALYNPTINKVACDIQKNTRATPYHIIRSWVDNSKGDYDVVDYVLLVFDEKELWDMERGMLLMGVAPTALMYNHSTGDTDLGDIEFDISEDGVLGRLGWHSYFDKIGVMPL